MKKVLLLTVCVLFTSVLFASVSLEKLQDKGYRVFDTGIVERVLEDSRNGLCFLLNGDKQGKEVYYMESYRALPRDFYEGETVYNLWRKGLGSTYYLEILGRIYKICYFGNDEEVLYRMKQNYR